MRKHLRSSRSGVSVSSTSLMNNKMVSVQLAVWLRPETMAWLGANVGDLDGQTVT